MKIRICLSSICFIILILLIALFLSRIIIFDVDDIKLDSYRIKTSFDEPKNSADVVFVGPSAAYCSWIPILAWEKYGISSMVLGVSCLPGSAAKYVINKILKRQKPKLIVYFADGLIEAPKKEDWANFHTFIQFISLFNRFQMINAMANESNLSLKEKMEYYFPIIRLHSKWKNLFSQNIAQYIPKGVLYAHSKYYSFENNLPDFIDKTPIIDKDILPAILPNDRTDIINNTLNYLSELNIPVLLVSTPGSQFLHNVEYYKKESSEFKAIFKIAEEKNIPYIDIRNINIIREMNLQKQDFLDYGHLNFFGAYKFTDYLAKILQEKYNIENKKSDDNYNFRNEEYSDYIDFIGSEYDIDLTKLINSPQKEMP